MNWTIVEVRELVGSIDEKSFVVVGDRPQCDSLMHRLHLLFAYFEQRESDPIVTVNNFWSMLGGTVVEAFQSLEGTDVEKANSKVLTPIENFKNFLKEFLDLISHFTLESHFISTWAYTDYVEEFKSFHVLLDIIVESIKDQYTEVLIDRKVENGSDLARYHPDILGMIDRNLGKYSAIKKSESRILSGDVVQLIELLLSHDSHSVGDALKKLPAISLFNPNYFVKGSSLSDTTFLFGRACTVDKGTVRGYPVTLISLTKAVGPSSSGRRSSLSSSSSGTSVSVKNEGAAAMLFLQEARLLQLHQLPGVLHLYGVDHPTAPTRLLTEHYHCSLETLLYDKQFRSGVFADWSLDKKLSVMAECANTFSFLHSIRVVHGDIQPRSILILADGRAKVAHFSLKTQKDVTDSSYTAPELLNSRSMGGVFGGDNIPYSEASDVFAFGVTMNEVLREQRPSGRPPALVLVAPQTSGSTRGDRQRLTDLKAIVEDCINEVPAQRGTFSQCSVDLHHLLNGETNHSSNGSSEKNGLLSAMRPPSGQYRSVSNVFIASDLFTGYYSGSLMGEVRHGKGCMQCLDGSSYDGEWDKNTRHGQGKAVELGDEYIGTFVNDLMEGKGVMTYSDGAVYEGDWKNSAMDGSGTMTYADGSVYVGEWKNNFMDGTGSMQYAAKDYYEGQWKENLMTGHGMMRYANGSVYVGGWRNGAMEGYGVMKYFNKDLYEGDWWFDKKEGRGIMKWYNGDIYEGDWKSNAMDGQGTMKCANGDVYEGEWVDSAIEGYGVMKYANGDVYKGSWILEQREGYGTMHFASGDEYEGDWKAGNMHGKGVMKYVNGEVYDGQWIDGTIGYGNHYKRGEGPAGRRSSLAELEKAASTTPFGRKSIIMEPSSSSSATVIKSGAIVSSSTPTPPPSAEKFTLGRLFSSVSTPLASSEPSLPPLPSILVDGEAEEEEEMIPPEVPQMTSEQIEGGGSSVHDASEQQAAGSDSGGSTDGVEESSISLASEEQVKSNRLQSGANELLASASKSALEELDEQQQQHILGEPVEEEEEQEEEKGGDDISENVEPEEETAVPVE